MARQMLFLLLVALISPAVGQSTGNLTTWLPPKAPSQNASLTSGNASLPSNSTNPTVGADVNGTTSTTLPSANRAITTTTDDPNNESVSSETESAETATEATTTTGAAVPPGFVTLSGFVEFLADGITEQQAEDSVAAALQETLHANGVKTDALLHTNSSTGGSLNSPSSTKSLTGGSRNSTSSATSSTGLTQSTSSGVNGSGSKARRLAGAATWLVQYALNVPQQNVAMVQAISSSTSHSVGSFERVLQQELTGHGANVPPDFSIVSSGVNPTSVSYGSGLIVIPTTTTSPTSFLAGSVQFLSQGVSQDQARTASMTALQQVLGVALSEFYSLVVQDTAYYMMAPCGGDPKSSCNTSFDTWQSLYVLQLTSSRYQQVTEAAGRLLQSQGFYQTNFQNALQNVGATLPSGFFVVPFSVPVPTTISGAPPMLLLNGSFTFTAAAITQDQAFAASVTTIFKAFNVSANSLFSLTVLAVDGNMVLSNGQLKPSRVLQASASSSLQPGATGLLVSSGNTSIAVKMWQVNYKLLTVYQQVPGIQTAAQFYNKSLATFQTILDNELIAIGAFVPSNFFVTKVGLVLVEQGIYAIGTTTTPMPHGSVVNVPEEICFFGCRPKTQGLVAIAVFIAVMIALVISGCLCFLWYKGFITIDVVGQQPDGKDEAELRRLEDERWQLAEAVAGQEEPPFKVPEAWTGFSAAAGGGGTGRKYRLNFLVGGKIEGQSQVFNRFYNVQGAYDLQDGHVTWREEAAPEVWERTCNVFEFAGTIRVRRVKDADSADKGDDFGWVNLREYDPMVPFDGNGYYVHEVAGEVCAFSSNEGKTELVSKEQLQIRTEAIWNPLKRQGKKLMGLLGY